MANGNIEIKYELRPCFVYLPKISYKSWDNENQEMKHVIRRKEETQKSLFHCWHPVTGYAIVEYEDGTIHEVKPTQIRFVDNAMSEYAFPEMKQTKI